MSRPQIVIGRGAMGEVYLAHYQGETVVVKKQRDIIDNTLLKEYSNYFKLQDNPNILKFYGVIRDDQYSFSLVLEYAPNGNLSSYLSTHTVRWNFKARICRDITLGLMHCHDNNVLHFDIKPENILLDQALIPKLADFGISKTKSQIVLDNGKAGGTLNYVAPERVCRDIKMREFFDNHPKLSDVYSFGLILWSVAKDGIHPYEGLDDDEIKEQKRSAHSIYRLLNQLPECTPPNYIQLIYDLTRYNPGERLDLTIARLELESLFDDEEEERPQSNYYPEFGNLAIHDITDDDDDDDDDDDCEIIEDSVAGSEPISTSTTIESVESNGYSEKSAESSSCELFIESRRASFHRSSLPPSRKNSESSNSNANSYKINSYKNGPILDRSIVASPTPNTPNTPNIDKNSMGIEIPTIPSLNSLIFGNGKNTLSKSGINSKHFKHDSGVAGIMTPNQNSQTTLVGSPTSPKNEENLFTKSKTSNADLALIEEVIAICDRWEEFNDDVMRRKLDILCHEKGINPQNLLEIFERYPEKSADHFFVIGFMNEHAFGKEKDPRTAFDYYFKASELGDSRGLVYVGWCYYKGMGTTKDQIKAFNCFQRAANSGCVSAQNNVGWCYDIGFGTSTNPYKAFEYFKYSADKGYTTAQCRVGVCYEYGRGTTKDLEKALEWYTKAADNGHETAKRRVNELSKLLRHGNRRKSFLERVFYKKWTM